MVTPIDVSTGAGPRSDAELLSDICADNPDALAPLFERYVRLVSGVAHRILGDRGEAEDVTQEIFLEIYRKAHLFSAERGSVRVWLLQYVYHRALRRKASLRRRAAYRGEQIETLDDPARARCRPQRPSWLSPDECRWVLHSGLDQLPTRQRATLELTCFEDLPLRDVAQRLGVSVGCTRHYYYRGLERLRRWASQIAVGRPNPVAPHEPVDLMAREAQGGGGSPGAESVARQGFADDVRRRHRRRPRQ
jgi:RNA polymerase sigma-70 factor (ECF subfamily)